MNPLNLPVANRPKLLVSVRNPEEARQAIIGGAEIIDIKEPSRGSLGKADDAVIEQIVQAVREREQNILISAALGELRDWDVTQNLPQLPGEVGLVKVGLSGLAEDRDWQEKWGGFRDSVQAVHSHALSWVMVAYADVTKANAPAPDDLIAAANSLDCRAVLFDTFSKDGRSLFEILSKQELLAMTRAVGRRKLYLAVAGSLRKDDLDRLDDLRPDIVAIRSAACRGGNRQEAVCSSAVRAFRDSLNQYPDQERFSGESL